MSNLTYNRLIWCPDKMRGFLAMGEMIVQSSHSNDSIVGRFNCPKIILFFKMCYYYYYLMFRAVPVAYGSSQAKG